VEIIQHEHGVIKLNMNDLPPGHDDREIVVVESGGRKEGRKVTMFSLLIFQGTSTQFPQNGSDRSHEWHMKSSIPLPNPIAPEYIYIYSTAHQ
jgi:hypothetical protein